MSGKRWTALLLCAALLLAVPAVMAAAEGELYLNETFQDTAAGAAPTKPTITGSGSIVRAVQGEGGKQLMVKNRWKDTSVNYSALAGGKFVYIETKALVAEVAAKRAVIQITDGKMVKYDLVCLDTGGRITDISNQEVTGYYANEWVEVAVKINTSTQKYSILIGGQTVKERIPISGLSGITAIGMTAYKNEAQECTMYVKYLRAYAGPERRAEFPAVAYNYETVEAKTNEVKLIEDKASLILSENFNAVNEGSMPSSMKAVNDVKAKKEQKNENRYVHINKADSNDAYVQIPLNMIFTTVVFQADYMYMQNSGGIELFQLKDAQDQFGNFVKINATGSLALYNDQKVGNYNFKDKWVNVAVAMDFDQKIFNVYINGKLEAKDVPFQNMSLSSNVAISRLTTTWNSKIGDNFGVDNIRIYSGMSLAGKFDEEDDGIEEVDESQIDKTPFRTDMAKFTPIKQDEYSNPSSYFSSYDNLKKNLKGKYAFVAENNKAWIQDDKYEMQSPAGLKSGNVTLPLSEVANFTGLALKKAEDGTVWLGDNIAVKAGEKTMTAYGEQVELPVAAEEINGQLYVAAKPLVQRGLKKYYFESFKGVCVISDTKILYSDKVGIQDVADIMNYIVFDRPNAKTLKRIIAERYPDNAHPRMVADRADFERMKQLTRTNDLAKKWSDEIIAAAEAYVKKDFEPISYREGGARMGGLLDRDMVTDLYWAYYMTGDKKFARKAIDGGLYMATFNDWHAHKSFLDTQQGIAASGLIIDLFYDEITQQEKDTIAKAMIDKGIKPAYEHYYGRGEADWPRRVNNYNIASNSGTIMGALVIMDEYETDLCTDVIEKGLRSIEYMMHNFAPEGAWMEGLGYWEFTVSCAVGLANSLETAFGTTFGMEEIPGFTKTGYFPFYASGNAGAYAYGDISRGFYVNSPEIMWLANYNHDSNLVKLRVDEMSKRGYRASSRELMWYDGSGLPEVVDLNLDMVYKNAEIATTRSDWSGSAVFAGMHAGANNADHGHLDIGSFEYEVYGTKFAAEMGSDDYTLPAYFGGNFGQYYAQRPEGHNLYVINPDKNAGQPKSAKAVIEEVASKPRGSIYEIDMLPAYKSQVSAAKRGFMLNGGRRIFTVQDEIMPLGNDEYYWFWHTEADIEINEAEHSVLLTKDGKKATVYFDSDLEFTIASGLSVPLPTSPQNENQLKGKYKPMNKITVRFTSREGQPFTFRAVAVPFGVSYERAGLTPMDSWSIEDGEFDIGNASKMDYADEILLDGQPIADFDQLKGSYQVMLDDASQQLPQVSATSKGKVTILQATRENPTATIAIAGSEVPDNVFFYSIEFAYVTKAGMPQGTVFEPVAINVSDEPQPENGRGSVNDNDPNTRWAAEGDDVWIEYDLGEVKDVNAVALAVYQGNERVQSFSVQVSEDGEHYKLLNHCVTTGTTADYENFRFETQKARYVRIGCYGTSVGVWNSITGLKVYGG